MVLDGVVEEDYSNVGVCLSGVTRTWRILFYDLKARGYNSLLYRLLIRPWGRWVG